MLKKPNLFLLSLLSILLLSLSWYWHLSILIFFAFVPLLIIENKLFSSAEINKPKLKLIAYSYLIFLSWNIGVTWWVQYASLEGAIAAFLMNALLMTIVFVFYSTLKSKLKKWWGVWLLIPTWIAFEHIHTIWDMSWTWLTLGNVFAFNHNWIQWYEYTGTSGGTLWILATNILIFEIVKNNSAKKIISKPILKIASLIIVPILISYLILFVSFNKAGHKDGYNCVIVQPNIDPYNDKFNSDYQSQFLKAMFLIRGKINSGTNYLILPETFITDNLIEEGISETEPVKWFKDSLLSKFPNLTIIAGCNSYKFYRDKKEITSTSRKDEESGLHYDVFNSAIQINSNTIQVYHKSKLVPGVERMPFPALLKPLESLAINLGGTFGSLGIDGKRSVFTSQADKVKIAPVICYESVYADYVTEYMRLGANIIFIITNDGWWQNTPGYKQHLNYARLRAIENRKQIVRCANTGTSCFIDEFGNTYQETNWWEPAVIEQKIYLNNSLTFFSRFGDMISYLSIVMSVLLVIWRLVLIFKPKNNLN
ncbi:MAG: apolipoprotein N-acyltransferase [Bacteroidota bacterium]|nr:apolipoprotein N-acyltransferase [Bacteroidota bacterium]